MKKNLSFKTTVLILCLLFSGLYSGAAFAQAAKTKTIKIVEINKDGITELDTVFVWNSDDHLFSLDSLHFIFDNKDENVHFNFDVEFDKFFEDFSNNMIIDIDDKALKSAKIVIDDIDNKFVYFKKHGTENGDETYYLSDKNNTAILIKANNGITREIFIKDIQPEEFDELKQIRVLRNEIEENLKIDSLQFYPNPNDGKFTISLKNSAKEQVEINVFNLSGLQVFSKKSNLEEIKEAIDISNYGNGTYFLQIIIGNKSHTKKIIIN